MRISTLGYSIASMFAMMISRNRRERWSGIPTETSGHRSSTPVMRPLSSAGRASSRDTENSLGGLVSEIRTHRVLAGVDGVIVPHRVNADLIARVQRAVFVVDVSRAPREDHPAGRLGDALGVVERPQRRASPPKLLVAVSKQCLPAC